MSEEIQGYPLDAVLGDAAYIYIADNASLETLCRQLKDDAAIAVDTEFIREHSYYPDLCLIQIANEHLTALIDPKAISNFDPLIDIFEDERITKIFHACDQDLEALFYRFYCIVRPIFDTQLAAAFLGARLQISLSQLVESYTGVHLEKTESLTDWAARPLTDTQLSYAAADVAYLVSIYRRMLSELIQKDRMLWFSSEMDSFVQAVYTSHDPRQQYLKLRHGGALSRRQLAIARELCELRDTEAASMNIPRRWLMTDELIVELCKKQPKTTADIHSIRGTDKIFAVRMEKDVLAAIKRGMQSSLLDIAENRGKVHPSVEQESVCDLLYAYVRMIAREEGLAPQLIANKDELLQFLLGHTAASLRTGWRYDLVGKRLDAMLAGEVGLTVKDGHIEVL